MKTNSATTATTTDSTRSSGPSDEFGPCWPLVVAGGEKIDPALHLAIHEIVAHQILDDEPPEMWSTAARLFALGYDKHEILHMLGSTTSNMIYDTLAGTRAYDRERQIAELDALPATWELARRARDL